LDLGEVNWKISSHKEALVSFTDSLLRLGSRTFFGIEKPLLELLQYCPFEKGGALESFFAEQLRQILDPGHDDWKISCHDEASLSFTDPFLRLGNRMTFGKEKPLLELLQYCPLRRGALARTFSQSSCAKSWILDMLTGRSPVIKKPFTEFHGFFLETWEPDDLRHRKTIAGIAPVLPFFFKGGAPENFLAEQLCQILDLGELDDLRYRKPSLCLWHGSVSPPWWHGKSTWWHVSVSPLGGMVP